MQDPGLYWFNIIGKLQLLVIIIGFFVTFCYIVIITFIKKMIEVIRETRHSTTTIIINNIIPIKKLTEIEIKKQKEREEKEKKIGRRRKEKNTRGIEM